MSMLDPFSLHAQQFLNAHYLAELSGPGEFDEGRISSEREAATRLEARWLSEELSLIAADSLPKAVDAFEPWYRARFRNQVAAAAAFFDYLAQQASLEELAIYVAYEEQVDGRFDDVIALAQLGLKPAAKVALASNYWDEMGEGDISGMHTRLFADSAAHFREAIAGTRAADLVQPTAEALANGNLLLFLALRRRHCAKLLGALTLLEHTAPRRFARTVQAMRRLGVPERVIYYHEMHVQVDARHGDDLLNEVLLPMLTSHPNLTTEVAIGVELRLQVANRYYGMLSRVFELARGEHAEVMS